MLRLLAAANLPITLQSPCIYITWNSIVWSVESKLHVCHNCDHESSFAFIPIGCSWLTPKASKFVNFSCIDLKKNPDASGREKRTGIFCLLPLTQWRCMEALVWWVLGKKMLWSVHCVQRKRPHSIHTSDPRMVAEFRKTHFVRKVETINSPRWHEIISDFNVMILLNLFSFIMQHMIQISPKKLSFARWTFRRENLRSTDKNNTIIILQQGRI